MNVKLNSNQIGTNITVDGILVSIPHGNIFKITDYSSNCAVFIQFGEKVNFNFENNLNKKVTIIGKVIPVGNTPELGILLTKITTSEDTDEDKYQILKSEIENIITDLNIIIKSSENLNPSDLISMVHSLNDEIIDSTIQGVKTIYCSILSCIINELKKIIQ